MLSSARRPVSLSQIPRIGETAAIPFQITAENLGTTATQIRPAWFRAVPYISTVFTPFPPSYTFDYTVFSCFAKAGILSVPYIEFNRTVSILLFSPPVDIRTYLQSLIDIAQLPFLMESLCLSPIRFTRLRVEAFPPLLPVVDQFQLVTVEFTPFGGDVVVRRNYLGRYRTPYQVQPNIFDMFFPEVKIVHPNMVVFFDMPGVILPGASPLTPIANVTIMDAYWG